MPLSILPDPPGTPVNQRSSFNLAHLKAGTILKAHIVQQELSGKTVLQFSGFRAVVDHLPGGREGDVLLFEVLPEEENGSRHSTSRKPSDVLSIKIPGTRGQTSAPQSIKILRSHVLSEAGQRQVGPEAKSIVLPEPVTQSFSFTLPAATGTPLSTDAFQLVAKWLRRFQKSRHPLQRSGETRTPPGLDNRNVSRESSSTPGIERPEKPATDRPPQLREMDAAAGPSGFYLGKSPVKMTLYKDASGHPADRQRPSLTAVFLLDLDHIGPIRTDITMSQDRITVAFSVANEECRVRFAKAMPALTEALSPLGMHFTCQVVVSEQKINDFLHEDGGGTPQHTRFAIRA
jgi:flagellar hook-length control protein FliK